MPRTPQDVSRSVVRRAADPREATRCALERLDLAVRKESIACVAVGLGSAAFVSSTVVRTLLEWLAEQGVDDVAVLAVVPQRDRDAGWDAQSLAIRHGLPSALFRDAWEVTAPAEVGEGHVIAGRPVPQAWQQADLRVVLAPCATDAVNGHVLVLDVLRSLPSLVAGADFADVVADVLQTMPPDLSIVDATITSDGIAGSALRHAVRTDTVIASTSAVLAELVGARALGVDPMRGSLLASVLPVCALPDDYRIDGDIEAFASLAYPPESLLRTTRSASPALARVIAAALAEQCDESDDDVVLSSLRDQLRPALTSTVGNSVMGSSLAWPAAAAASIVQAVDAFSTTYAKDSVSRRVASLGINLELYRAGDYDEAETALRPLLQLLEGLPVDDDGLRWTHMDGAVVFEAARVVRAPYDLWCERVDVSAAIATMADYLGGSVVVVRRDKEGRPTRQAERNIYLPQPNYAAFSGGQAIDVCKLSVIRYRADSREIWWRTVRSPNGSAVYDDGTVCFADAGDDRTRVTIRGRQQFTLPPSLQALDLDLQPALRDSLTHDAYRRFFSTTLDNFEACYEGREFAIGKDPDPELATKGLSRLVKVVGESVSQWSTSGDSGDSGEVAVEVTDDHGFRHVAGSRR